MQLKQGLESANGHWLLKFRWQFIPQYTTYNLLVSSGLGLGLVILVLVLRIWSCLHHWVSGCFQVRRPVWTGVDMCPHFSQRVFRGLMQIGCFSGGGERGRGSVKIGLICNLLSLFYFRALLTALPGAQKPARGSASRPHFGSSDCCPAHIDAFSLLSFPVVQDKLPTLLIIRQFGFSFFSRFSANFKCWRLAGEKMDNMLYTCNEAVHVGLVCKPGLVKT